MSLIQKLQLGLRHGEFFEVDKNALNRVAALLKNNLQNTRPFDWRNPVYWPEDAEGKETVSQFFTIGNSINFRYWSISGEGKLVYCKASIGGRVESDAYYMWRCLKRTFDDESFPILDAQWLSSCSIDHLRAIFHDDDGRDVMPALEERLENWHDFGVKLLTFWDGRFSNLVKACGDSLYNFVQYSRQFRAFDDPVSKLIMVNALMHQGRELVSFSDGLFPAVDYELVKQLLRQGVIRSKKEEAGQKLKSYKLLEIDEESELRRVALYAFAEMMNQTGIRGDVIDNAFWMNRVKCGDIKPVCTIEGKQHECPFLEGCAQRTEFLIPLKLTRYY